MLIFMVVVSTSVLGQEPSRAAPLRAQFVGGGAKRTAVDELNIARRLVKDSAAQASSDEAKRSWEDDYASILRQISSASGLSGQCHVSESIDRNEATLVYSWTMTTQSGAFCGGWWLSSSWLLTAASCLDGLFPKDVVAMRGDRMETPVRFLIHSSHKSAGDEFDLAVVQFSEKPITSTVEETPPELQPGCARVGSLRTLESELVLVLPMTRLKLGEPSRKWVREQTDCSLPAPFPSPADAGQSINRSE
jgi:hypothetical protein